ncbi:MAG: hypothetical protein ACOX6O_04925 [Christensenellales bacterium]|jgi:hypothetical protein
MTGIMHQVYQALTALPISLSRAWPQAAQPLPALSFSLLDYQEGERGLDTVKIRAAIRAALPEEADTLAEQAVAALAPLGLALDAARDEAEADSGVFLKSLAFSGQAAGGQLRRLSLSIKTGDSWMPLTGLRQAAFTPAERVYRDIRALSETGPRHVPGEIRQAALHLLAAAWPTDPGQQAMKAAFLSGTPLDWRLEGGSFTQEGRGLVMELDASALGFAARIQIIP